MSHVHEGADAAGPPASSPSGDAILLAGLTGAAGLMHVVMVPGHAALTMADGVGMAAAAWAQLWLAVALLTGRARRPVLWCSAAVNAGALAALVAASTVGLPYGAHAGAPESPGVSGAVIAVIEGLAVVLAVVSALRPRPMAVPRLTATLGGVAAVALVTAVSLSPTAVDHHAHESTAPGDAAHGHGGSAATLDAASLTAELATIDNQRCDTGFNPAGYWQEARLLGIDVHGGGAIAVGAPTATAQAVIDNPGPGGGRGSATLDELIALTSKADEAEGSAARLIVKLGEADDATYWEWLGWLRANRTTAHDHGSGSGDDSGGHGGHVGPQPWTAITDVAQCDRLTGELEQARATALRYPTVAEAEAAGWVKVTGYVPGIAAHYMNFGLVDGRFEIDKPEMLLYDGTQPTSRIVGVSYYLKHDSTIEPTQGFSGANDHFHRHVGLCVGAGGVIGDSTTTAEQCAQRGGRKADGGDGWMSHAWVVPGCESPWGVFSAVNPLLDRALGKATGTDGGGCAASGVRDRYDLTAGSAASLRADLVRPGT